MSNLVILDLPRDKDLDRQAARVIVGGASVLGRPDLRPVGDRGGLGALTILFRRTASRAGR